MFISHFHCLTLVQPSLIHLWTIRTAFQLVPLVARDPPLPIHPTYFVSGNLPKTPLSFSSLGRLSSSITSRFSKIQMPSILLNLIPLVLNIYSLILWSSQVLLYTSPQTTISPGCSLAPLPGMHLFPSAIKIQQVQDLAPTLSVSEVYCLTNIWLLLSTSKALFCHCGWFIQPWTGNAERRS